MDSVQGKLLLASPALVDPNFARTVVLVVEHDEEGALGVVLNRPSEVRVAESAPVLSPLAGDEDPVFVGGPVGGSSLVILAEFSDPSAASSIVAADVGLVSAEADIEDLPAAVRRARIYAGHAGWGPGQLDRELEEDSWIVEAPLPGELFPEHPEELWSRVLERKGGQYALIATMPADPSLN